MTHTPLHSSHADEVLAAHGVKPTSVRILVWRKAEEQSEAFTLHDMEQWMPHMDRSSIFRALRLFAEHQLLHELDDGTGQRKYCVCRCSDQHHHPGHVHFTCRQCGRTYCLEDYHIPSLPLPPGFTQTEADYVVKGTCPNCQK